MEMNTEPAARGSTGRAGDRPTFPGGTGPAA